MKLGKKKQESALDENVLALMAKLNDKYGEGTVLLASEAVGLNLRFLRTGVHRLDFALGGGWPEGRIIEVFGAESSGKTTLALTTIREFQKKYPSGIAAFIDLEKSFSPAYARYWGVDLQRLVLVNPDSGEQASDLIAEILAQESYPVLVVVDSIAAMVPTTEVEGSASDANVGLHPRLINKTMRLCTARMKRSLSDPDYPSTTAIFLNQVREKIGVMFGNPETTPGGKGKNFFASVRVRLFSGVGKKTRIEVPRKVGDVTQKILVARNVSFEVVKNKCGGAPFADGEYVAYVKPYNGNLAWSFDNIDALTEFGIFHKLIEVGGGYLYTTDSGDEVSGKKHHLFLQALRDSSEAQEELYNKIVEETLKANSGEAEEVEAVEEEVG